MRRIVIIARIFAILFPVCFVGCYLLLALSFSKNSLAPPAMVASLGIWITYAVGLFVLGSIDGETPLGAAAWLNLKRTLLWNLFALPTWLMLVGVLAPLAIMFITSMFILGATSVKEPTLEL